MMFLFPIFGALVLGISFVTGSAPTWPLRRKRSDQPGVFWFYVAIWLIFTSLSLWMAVGGI